MVCQDHNDNAVSLVLQLFSHKLFFFNLRMVCICWYHIYPHNPILNFTKSNKHQPAGHAWEKVRKSLKSAPFSPWTMKVCKRKHHDSHSPSPASLDLHRMLSEPTDPQWMQNPLPSTPSSHCSKMLFVDLSSAFHTVSPMKMIGKLDNYLLDRASIIATEMIITIWGIIEHVFVIMVGCMPL